MWIDYCPEWKAVVGMMDVETMEVHFLHQRQEKHCAWVRWEAVVSAALVYVGWGI